MRSLLLYNDNLRVDIIKEFSTAEVINIPRATAQQENFDADQFYHDRLAAILSTSYDIIFLTFNFSVEDFLELSGFRLALHIRLTPKLNHSRTPIVFLSTGDGQNMQMRKLSTLGDVLFTRGTFTTPTLSIDGIKEVLGKAASKTQMNDEDYQNFLNHIKIQPLETFQSPHAISNEWSLHRLFSMTRPEPSNSYYTVFAAKAQKLRILDTLYFKYVEARYKREKFKDNQLTAPGINGVQGAKIAIIDDEVSKGWGDFFNYLIKKSQASPLIFDEFKKHWSKEELINNLLVWLDQLIADGDFPDVFVIDLRLHESDVYQTNTEELCGILIIKEILKRNKGAQFLVFTASNKAKNIQVCIKLGAVEYITKEGPESYLNREGSKSLLLQLTKGIEKAKNGAFLVDAYNLIEAIRSAQVPYFINSESKTFWQELTGPSGALDQLFILLRVNIPTTIPQCVLNIFHILERYTELSEVCSIARTTQDDARSLTGSVHLKTGNEELIFAPLPGNLWKMSSRFTFTFGQHPFQRSTNDNPISVQYFTSLTAVDTFKSGKDVTSNIKMIAVLKYRNNISEPDLNELIKLRFYRSNVCAHDTGDFDHEKWTIGPQEVLFLLRILKHIFF